jgi:hypothetical protein
MTSHWIGNIQRSIGDFVCHIIDRDQKKQSLFSCEIGTAISGLVLLDNKKGKKGKKTQHKSQKKQLFKHALVPGAAKREGLS